MFIHYDRLIAENSKTSESWRHKARGSKSRKEYRPGSPGSRKAKPVKTGSAKPWVYDQNDCLIDTDYDCQATEKCSNPVAGRPPRPATFF